MKFFHKGSVPDPAIFSKLGTIPKEFLVHPLVRANLGDRAVYIYRYFKNGDLSKSMPLSEQVVTNTVVPSVCAALERIHGAGLIHRDIKPENLMWNDEKNGVLLSDFGISSLLEKGASIRRTKGSGTAGYTAPETLNGYVSAKSDYYSFGVTLLCLLMGMDPFAGMTDAQIIFNVINKQLEIPSFISDRMRRLIKGLTIKDRGLRWGADEVKQWLSGSSQGTAPAGIGSGTRQPIMFDGREYSDFTRLAEDISSDWQKGLEFLYGGALEGQLTPADAKLKENCFTIKKGMDKDLSLTKLLLLLDSKRRFCYKGLVFNNAAEFADAVLDGQDDRRITEFVSGGGLAVCLRATGSTREYVDRIRRIVDKMNSSESCGGYVYAIAYIISGRGYGSENFGSISRLVDSLESTDDLEREKTASRLVCDTKFYMWLYSLGYEDIIEKYLEVEGE